MTTEYRMLDPKEPVQQGDEYWLGGEWNLSGNWNSSCNPKREQMADTKYRRPVPKSPACVPQWRHPEAPGCPVHVLWAESPSSVRTVAQVAAEAKPRVFDEDVEPGTGYYIVPTGEFIQEGDEWYSGAGKWKATQLPGGQYKHACPLSILRRKKAPEYRPYANAAEAAAGLQGKLICHINEPGNYYHPLSVGDAGFRCAGHRYTMMGLKEYWKFTDGTPCGVLITNQGTK